MRPLLAVAVLAAAAPAAAERQEPVVDRRWGYQVDIPEGWKAQPLEGAPPDVLLLYTHEPSDRMLVVSKVTGPSEDADLEVLEAGIQAKAQRYKRLSAKKRALGLGRKSKVPAWDLWFRLERDGRPVTMGTRFLFYKSYALSILVDAPGSRTPGREARKIVESFVPPPPPK
jgi:hypothetical protein